ncbi:MAG: hypothetical protein HY326_13410 [Chloroflexi bacterium]|nr:hypothetical protein [Chloroflexota bacterium]
MIRWIMIVTAGLSLMLAGVACSSSTPTPVAQQPPTAVPQISQQQPAATATTPLPPMPPTLTPLPPTATPIPPSPTPTVPPQPPLPVPPEAQSHFQKAAELYKTAAQSQKFQPAIDELVQGIRQFLASLPQGAESIKAPGTTDDLAKQLNAFGQMAKPAVVVGNFFSESQPAVAVSTGGPGLPVLVFQATKAEKPLQPGDFNNTILPPTPAASQEDLGPMVNTAQKMGDLNKDGKYELLISSQITGASSITTVLHIYQAEGTNAKEIFATSLNNWAGGGDWKLVQLPNGAYNIVATCAAFGTFDQKRLPHPIETITYQWIEGKYIVYSRTQEKPATTRQAVNVAEQAFIEGRHRDSMDAYLKATTDSNLRQEQETNQIDWINVANLRLGMILAINGNETRARSFLENAMQKDDIFGQIATRFLHEYKSVVDAPRAWGAVSNLPLRQEAYQNKIPMDPAWVDQLLHPIYAAVGLLNLGRQTIGGPDQFKQILQDDGLDVTDLQVGDMDGDGNPEAIISLNIVGPNELYGPTGKKAEAWLLTRTRQGWRAVDLEANVDQGGSVKIKSMTPVKGVQDQSAVVLDFPSNRKAVEKVFGWDGSNLVDYKDATNFEKVTSGSAPAQCIVR